MRQSQSTCNDVIQEGFPDAREMLMDAPIGIFTSTLEGRFLSVNSFAARMLGYGSPGELVDSVHDIGTQIYADPEDRKEIIRRLASSRVVEGYECRLVRKDGTQMWISNTVKAVRDKESGEITHLHCFAVDITERKQTEEALRKSEERLNMIVNNISDIVWFETTDPEGNSIFSYISPAGAKFLGITDEELNHSFDVWFSYVLPEDLPMVKEAMTTGKGEPVDYRVKTADGSIKWIQSVNNHMYNQDGSFSLVGSGREITQLKIFEEAIRQSENQFKSLFMKSPISIIVHDKESGEIIDANAAAYASYGFSSLNEMREGVFSLGTPYSSEDSLNWIRKASSEGPQQFEWQSRRKNNDLFWELVFLNPLTINGVERVVASCIDITERKQAEEKLKIFREALESSTDAIGMSTPQGFHYYQNRAFIRLLGKVGDGEHPPDTRYVDRTVGEDVFRTIMAGGHWMGEVKMYAQDNRILDVSLRAYASKDKGGVIKSLVGIHTDITALKAAETERQKLQAQLFQAQKMESIGILAGGVAHDFNNLLQIMGGTVELLLQSGPPEIKEFNELKTIERAVDRAKRLVRQLLFFSRKAECHKRRLNVNQLLRNMVVFLERTLPKMVAVELHLEDNVWPLHADQAQIEQVLLNLGSNAADAMPEGGRLIIETSNIVLREDHVRMHVEARPGKHVLLSVSDTGCGMSRETMSHLFEPFFTTKEVGKGTGLGLASVYGIVKAHEGSIQCFSKLGQGTTFRIFLPVCDVPARSEIAPADQEAIPKDAATILLVEDEPDLRDLTAKVLEKHGYTVIPVSSGEQALEEYAKKGAGIDLVVLDLSMPGMGGHLCLQELQKHDPDVRVLIASGYSVHGQALKTSKMASGFLSKPYLIRELLAKVREVLHDHSS